MALRILLALGCGGTAAAAPAVVKVGSARAHAISPFMYSLFYETEINFGGEGGLYAELIWNRDFEALGRAPFEAEGPAPSRGRRDHRGSVRADPPAVPTDYRPWAPVGSANLSIDSTTAPYASNPHSLHVRAAAGAGVSNPGYWGVPVPAGGGPGFVLSLLARGAPRLVAQLRSGATVLSKAALVPDGKPVSPGWASYSAVLPPAGSPAAVSATFELVLADGEAPAEFWLDAVSLRPADAVAGLFRKDLFDMMAALKPGFMRTPGGNYLEGYSLETRWEWKKSTGPWAARPGHYNSAWGYWVTDGLGCYELLLLAELLGTEAQMAVYTGYSMNAPYVPLNESQVFADDALDMVEFANGGPATRWGAVRAAMGHPAAFGLRRMEVGNEEKDPAYGAHYALITSQLWAKHPEIQVVASGRWGPALVDHPCLTGQRCDAWDDHYYRSPDDMAAMAHLYDSYNRSWPKVFVGEYAALGDGPGRGTLRSAVAEAAMLIGLERNADVAVASAFAPLFTRVSSGRSEQWKYDLINFNGTAAFGLPAYHSQLILSHSLGDYMLKADLSGGGASGLWIACASVDASSDVTVKFANYAASMLPVSIDLQQWAPRKASKVEGVVLTAAEPEAQNTLERPLAVAPAPLAGAAVAPGGALVELTLPAWSVSVVKVTMSAPALLAEYIV